MKRFIVTGLKLAVAIAAAAYFFQVARTADEWHFIDNVNLIIHEAGHTIAFFMPEMVQIAAGSLFQILVPFIFVAYFFLRTDLFSGALVLFWVGQSIINVSVYAGDAVVQVLPLLGGDGVIHDWNYLLSSLNALAYTHEISTGLYGIGVFLMIIAAAVSVVDALPSFRRHLRGEPRL